MLQLIGDVANTISFDPGQLESITLLIEQRLLFSSLRLQLGNLIAPVVDALRQIGGVDFRLLQK